MSELLDPQPPRAGASAGPSPRWRRWLPAAAVACLVLIHFVALVCSLPLVINSPDANGYYVQVPRLAHHGSVELGVESPLQYVGDAWLDVGDGRFYSKYGPGVAIVLAPLYALFGAQAALYATPLMASLSLGLLFLFSRRWLGDPLAAVAAAVFALHPDANLHALNWGAHTQVTFVLLLGLCGLQRWSRVPSQANAALCGLTLGLVPLVRPAEALAALGVAGFVLCTVYRQRVISQAHARTLGALAAGAAVPLCFFGYHNTVAFGGPLATGYAVTGEQQLGSAFAWAFFEAKWRPMLVALMTEGAGVFFGLGLAGLVAMARAEATRALAVLLLGLIVPLTLLHMAYYWGVERETLGNASRLLIPTLPFYVPAGLFMLQRTARGGPTLYWTVGVVVALQAVLWGTETRDRTRRSRPALEPLHAMTSLLLRELPERSVLIVDPVIGESLQYFDRWLVLDADVVRGDRLPAAAPRHAPNAAHPLQAGHATRLRAELLSLTGAPRAERVRGLLQELARRRRGGTFWLMPASEAGSLQSAYGWMGLERVAAHEVRAPDTTAPAGANGPLRLWQRLPGDRKLVPGRTGTFLLYRASGALTR